MIRRPPRSTLFPSLAFGLAVPRITVWPQQPLALLCHQTRTPRALPPSPPHCSLDLMIRRPPCFNDTATTEIYTLSLTSFRSRWSPYHLIGRASCRERVEISVVAVPLKKKKQK